MEAQLRTIFRSGITLRVEHREKLLKRLKQEILTLEPEIFEALKKDLGKCEFEARATETGFTISEINHTLNHLYDWTRVLEGPAPLVSQPAGTRLIPSPKGTVLILSPWNYPFQLTIAPLVAAIAAGNTVAVKPSELTPHVSNIVKKLIAQAFPHGEAQCVLGGADVAADLLKQPFNHFFYTGGTRVGKIVAHAAAEQLASVTLELGGKSPCIVDATADIKQTARRIAWGKALNAGQTCVAPDYLIVHEDIHDRLVDAIKSEWNAFYGNSPDQSPDYGRIISHHHFDRLDQMLKSTKGTILGGRRSRDEKYIEPTLITNIDTQDSSMAEEIFGPILPVLKWNKDADIEAIVDRNPDPLALYVFTSKSSFADRLLLHFSFGGGCVNHIAHHLGCPELPFGGIRTSGVGNYHGKFGFDTFTHYKGILNASTRFDLKLKYPPYGNRAGLLKWLYK
jgi:acyl-CoA reductase-like NAD-dependent aldehyde dehydrogenase